MSNTYEANAEAIAQAASALAMARDNVADTVNDNEDELHEITRLVGGTEREAVKDILQALDAWRLASETFARALRRQQRAIAEGQ